MNRLLSIILITTLSGITVLSQVNQQLESPAELNRADTRSQQLPDEKVTLLTDRSLYVTGENIYLSCFIHYQDQETIAGMNHSSSLQYSDNQPNQTATNRTKSGKLIHSLSTIIYVELISPGGNKIAGQKYKTIDQHSSGQMHIPAGIESGIYFLRAYTKFQRNYGPSHYTYQALKVINPNSREVLKENRSAKDSHENSAKIDTIPASAAGFSIMLEKEQYRTSQNVIFNVQPDSNTDSKLVHGAISIIPLHTFESTSTKPVKATSRDYRQDNKKDDQKPLFEKETKGIIISGLSDNIDRSLPGAGQVNMTLINDPVNLFYPVKTNSEGRFSFSMPDLFEPHEIYIAPASPATSSQVKVDNDFCAERITLPAPLFSLDIYETAVALQLAQNEMIMQQYGSESNIKRPERNILLNDTTPFYGRPDQVIFIDDYISMPRLSDYLIELPSQVRIRHAGGKPSLQVISKTQTASVFPPLVMVDFVQLHDMQAFLDLDPSKIERLEIITSSYIRGTQIYGGIISVISSENDFAGAQLPETGLFLNYQFLEPQAGLKTQPEPTAHAPVVTNTLLWKTQPDLNGDQQKAFTFRTSDVPGEYMISIIGYNAKGEYINSAATFEVK